MLSPKPSILGSLLALNQRTVSRTPCHTFNNFRSSDPVQYILTVESRGESRQSSIDYRYVPMRGTAYAGTERTSRATHTRLAGGKEKNLTFLIFPFWRNAFLVAAWLPNCTVYMYLTPKGYDCRTLVDSYQGITTQVLRHTCRTASTVTSWPASRAFQTLQRLA